MGVVYKTKEQIKEFIIEAKKANPILSCRQLTPLIKEKFGISLSKSTINNIFKEANLSGPVGRKPLKREKVLPVEEKPKLVVEEKPTLPAVEQPQSLLSTERPALIEAPKEAAKEPVKEPPAEPVIITPAPSPGPEIVPQLPPEPEKPALPPTPLPASLPLSPPPPPPAQPAPEPVKKAPEPTVVPERPAEQKPVAVPPPVPEPVVAKEDTIKTPLAEPLEILQPIEIKEDEELDGLGCFFLKAAEWQLSNESILGNLLKKYLAQTRPAEINLHSEILLYMEAFGLSDWSAFEKYDQKGIWVVNQSPVKKTPAALARFSDQLKRLRGLSLALFNEYHQYFNEFRYVKVTLEDGTVYYLDAQFRTLWQDSNVPEVLSITQYKSNSYVRDALQNNVQSVILQTAPGYNAFSRVLSEFIWSCEAIPQKRIVRIGLFNLKREEVLRIVDVSEEKRRFIVGFWPWQEEGMRFIREDLRIVKNFFLPELKKEIFYSENTTTLQQPVGNKRLTVRIGLIRDTALGWPRSGVLTNIPSETASMAEIISSYLRRWPSQEEGYQDLVRRTSKFGLRLASAGGWQVRTGGEETPQVEYSLSLASTDLRTNLNSLLFAFNNLAQRYFFPRGYERVDFATMQKRFYLIAGHIEMRNNLLSVILHPPKNYAFLPDLVYACQRLNESDIETPTQEKLILRVA